MPCRSCGYEVNCRKLTNIWGEIFIRDFLGCTMQVPNESTHCNNSFYLLSPVLTGKDRRTLSYIDRVNAVQTKVPKPVLSMERDGSPDL